MNPALPKQIMFTCEGDSKFFEKQRLGAKIIILNTMRKGWVNLALPKTHYVYLLLSEKGEHLYIGCTANLEKRINEHQAGKVFSTKKYLPMKLIYYETCISRIDAFNREKSLKKYGSALAKLKLRLSNSLQGGRAG